MSGSSYDTYKSSIKSYLKSPDSERKTRITVTKTALKDVRPEEVDHTKFNKSTKVNPEKARLEIKKPVAKKNYLVAVDDSASNEQIAEHIKQCGGFLLAPFGAMDISTSMAFIFFSDHGDSKPEQDIGFIQPSAQGDDELTASMNTIRMQNGYDIPEMIECVMQRAARDLPVDGTDTTFVLITDSVPHGMGFSSGDSGCPNKVDWKEALAEVKKKYSDFILIGCTDTNRYPSVSDLQVKFFDDEKKRALNFIDLSSIEDTGERQRLVVNALQFVAMRDQGKESIENYFKVLYEKLLAEGLRGQETDADARDRISRFMKYMDIDAAEKKEMLKRIFGE